MKLTRLSPRGRPRIKPRVEELTKIPIHGVVTNKGGRHTVRDGDFTLEFVDEVVDGLWRLVVYQNGVATHLSYQLAEKRIGGVIKTERHWSNDCQYYILVNGRRYSHLYVDKKNKKVGTKDCFGAVWTSQSLGNKQKPIWREYREIQKKAARLER
jgi:FMN phosphatase YigB (HAD superfamily)